MSVDVDGNLNVEIVDGIPLTGFGEVNVAQNRPYIQSAPLYNLIPSNFREFTSGSGSTGAEDRMFKVSTGTSVGGYGAIQSFRALNYKPGESGMVRYTAIFESNVASSWQGAGLIGIGDELSFGYNGTSFGIWHRYGGLPEVRTITVTGNAGGSETLTLTLNGTAYSIPLTSGTEEHNAYEIADWLNANQSVWGADQVDDTVIINSLSDGAKSGSYTYSSSTSTGTIDQNTSGVTKTSDFVAQADWNGESIASLDPSKGNVYEIQYQYLGFGNIFFHVEDPTTGIFKKVHTIRYSNKYTTPSLINPSLRTGLYCVSLGSTTDLIVRTASFGAFVQGQKQNTRNPRAYENTQSVSTSFTNILTIRNRRTYNYLNNQVEIEPRLLTISSESTKNVEIEVRSAVNTGAEHNFTAFGNNLVTDVDTSSVEVTAGILLAAFTLSGGDSASIDLMSLDIRLPPSLNLVIQGRVTSGSSSSVSASLVWYEDL